MSERLLWYTDNIVFRLESMLHPVRHITSEFSALEMKGRARILCIDFRRDTLRIQRLPTIRLRVLPKFSAISQDCEPQLKIVMVCFFYTLSIT